jgi:hypothetical protein
MREKRLVLAFIVLVFAGSWIPANADQIQIITELGNVFTATIDDSSENNGSGTGDGRAMINGMGINSRIINRDYAGKLHYGYGVSGTQSSLNIYHQVPALTDFAAQILETDPKTTMIIPKFNTEYQYVPSTKSLQKVSSTTPNILGYSQSRTVGGGATVSQGTDGITISGTGTVLLKLNDYSGQNLVVEGTIPSGGNVKFGYDLQYDYINADYHSTRGFKMWSGPLPASTSAYGANCWYSGQYGTQCGYYYYWTQNFSPPLVVTASSNYAGYSTSGHSFGIKSGSANTFVIPNTYSINSIEHSTSNSAQICSTPRPRGGFFYNVCYTSINSPSGTLEVFDKGTPIMNTRLVDASQPFQISHQFVSGKQYYVIAQPNGGTITIKGSQFNPSSTPYLKITSLPSNVPYEIVKDGFVTAKGMSQSDGTLSLLLSDVSIQGTNANGILVLYPDSLRYRGQFSMVVFDNINGQTIHIPTSDDKVYVAHAYVQIPVVGSVSVDSVRLSGGSLGDALGPLYLPYLDGNYTDIDLIRVPVIPGYHNIKMNINGIASTTVIANVLGGTGIKVAEPTANTINALKAGSPLSHVDSTAGTSSYVISTTSGNINAIVLATISGTSTIQNTVTLEAVPPPPPPPPRRDPLSAWVDVYRNGALVEQKQLYFNDQPTFTPGNSVSGNSQIQTAAYVYPQATVSGTITVSAQPGDMVEYYLYAKIHADGIALNPPSGFKVVSVSSSGTATASIHSGSINTSY